jgi:hypothetical protein
MTECSKPLDLEKKRIFFLAAVAAGSAAVVEVVAVWRATVKAVPRRRTGQSSRRFMAVGGFG